MSTFDSPLRRLARGVHFVDDAIQDLFDTLRENDGDAHGKATQLLASLGDVLALANQRLEGIVQKRELVRLSELAASDDDFVPADQVASFLAAARSVRFLAAFNRSIEIKDCVNDHFTVVVVEWGGAQILFRNCQNSYVHRDRFILFRPIQHEIVFVNEFWAHGPDHLSVRTYFEDFLPNWSVLSLCGEQANRTHQVDFDSVDLAPLRALIGDDVVGGLSDASVRLLVKLAVMPDEFREDDVSGDRDVDAWAAEDVSPLPPRPTDADRGNRNFPFDDLVELCMAMHTLVPATVAFEIFEFLPGFKRASRFAKMRAIASTYKSISNVVAQRSAAAAASSSSSSSSQTRGGQKRTFAQV